MTKKLNNLDEDHKHENLDNICENCNIENETVYQNLWIICYYKHQ